LAEARGQKSMSFDDAADEVEKEKLILEEEDLGEDEEEILPTLTKLEKKAEIVATTAADQMLSGMMGDAPPCPTCGHITIRSGSCYKCLNCGSTTGCS